MNNKYLEILRDIKSCSFATVDKYGKPQIRIIDVMMIKDNRLYFCTARGKSFYDELIRSKSVAIVGMTKQYQTVRLSGDVEWLKNDKSVIDEIFMNNPVMNDIYPGNSKYILEGFYVEKGIIDYFDLSTKPITRVIESIGGKDILDKGFFIDEGCMGCGKCAVICPQSCIDSGKPFSINQSNCLKCGLCFEICPVKAIEKR